MGESDNKAYDLEKKAFAILTQAFHKDSYHQFAYCTTTKNLWDVLEARREGNAATRKIRHDLLKKEFEGFLFMENETLNDMATRFYHLLSEMHSFRVNASQQEIAMRFADALPPKWSQFIELLKHASVLDGLSIYEFVQKLENKYEEKIRKEKRILVPQNPEMYFGDKDEMELMDIKWAFASAVRRAKDYTRRTGRTSLESKRDTKYGFDKDVVKSFNCGEKVNNPSNSNQSGPSNLNRALVVHADDGCDWSVQLGNGGYGGTACYAKIINHIKHVHREEFSEDDDSSGYSGSSDEESSSAGDYGSNSDVKKGIDVEVGSLLKEAEELKSQKFMLIRKAEVASKEMEKFFIEDGSSSYQAAFMDIVGAPTSQVQTDTPSICNDCADLKHKLQTVMSHNKGW
ncbi:uncharacterized protein LOC110902177 [Helianthus annuus]|uniref:uncharacterized protein LOC110902177 n=1 Tax=Helianthus annuus TaxID=4232 RepID=UPI000B90866F|nr:uncharacterized protein LOC110902177 [Helianthus annuus]